jgi:hypothetical protein
MTEPTHARIARIEGIDATTGEFQMTLASEGEASDGDILSIAGGEIPDRMPLLTSHWNDPTVQLGSIVDPRKALKEKPPRLRATGKIELGGDGPTAEIRRDLAYMISKGHVGAVSIRWEPMPGKMVRRVNLPSDHPYFVDAEKAQGPEKYGYYHEEWRALEGSVVALGADPLALIGRSNETEGEVRSFWRAMASDLEGKDKAEQIAEAWKERDAAVAAVKREEPSIEARRAAALACVREGVAQARALGLEADEIEAVIQPVAESDEQILREMRDSIRSLEQRIDALNSSVEVLGRVPDAPPASIEGRVSTGDPLPPAEIVSPSELAALLGRELRKAREEVNAQLRAEIEKARGKV